MFPNLRRPALAAAADSLTTLLREELPSEAAEPLLARLTQYEVSVLALRHGLLDGSQWTLSEIGEVLGKQKEPIRRIQASAAHKVQRGVRGVELGPGRLAVLVYQINLRNLTNTERFRRRLERQEAATDLENAAPPPLD